MITNEHISAKPTLPPLLKVREVAKLLSLSRVTVHTLIDSGDLQASPLHSTKKKAKRVHKRITRTSLLRFYAKRFGHPLNLALQNPFPA